MSLLDIEIVRDDRFRITNDLDLDIIYHVTTPEAKYKATIGGCVLCGYDFEEGEGISQRLR